MNPKAQRAIEAIRRAFAKREYPGDDRIVPGGLCKPPPPGDFDDYYDIQESFRGKRWDEVPDHVLDHHNQDLPLMTADAFCYYLPAFLVASLREVYDSTLQQFTIFALLLSKRDPALQEYKLARFSKLTPEERAAVREALEVWAEDGDEDAQRALDSYWAKSDG